MALVLAVLTVVMSLWAGALATPRAMADDDPSHRRTAITWNMQGATQNSESQWTDRVASLVNAGPDIVAIQEAGPQPPLPDRTLLRDGIVQFRWTVRDAQRNSHDYTVLWLQTDPGANRNNVALVLRDPPDGVTVSPNQFDRGRNMIGVRYGETWYFTFHALSGGGVDARQILAAVNSFAADDEEPGSRWVVMGDFNRSPDSLTLPANSHLERTGRMTQRQGNELDYAVASDNAGTLAAQRPDNRVADHWWVGLGVVPPNVPLEQGGISETPGQQPPDNPGGGSGGSGGNGTGQPLQPSIDQFMENLGDHQAGVTAAEALDRLLGWSGTGFLKREVGVPDNPKIDDLQRFADEPLGNTGRATTATYLVSPGSAELHEPGKKGEITPFGPTGPVPPVINPTQGKDAAKKMPRLVDTLLGKGPNPTVVLGEMPPVHDNDQDQKQIDDFNGALRTMVEDYQKDGKHVLVTDSGLTLDDIDAATSHISDEGYRAMGDKLATAVREAVGRGWLHDPDGGKTPVEPGTAKGSADGSIPRTSRSTSTPRIPASSGEIPRRPLSTVTPGR